MLAGRLAGLVAGWQAGKQAGWLAGCGDTDLRVNRAHGHFDLHVNKGPQDVPRDVSSQAYISTRGR